MMNKIYKAFDHIKLNKELKDQLYINMKHRKPIKTNYHYFIISSLAMASLILTFFLYDYHSPDNKKDEPNLTNEYIHIETNDTFLYNQKIYRLDSISTNKKILDKKIGYLHQIPDNLELINNFDSYHHDKASIYTVKGIKSNQQLAIIEKDTILLFNISK